MYLDSPTVLWRRHINSTKVPCWCPGAYWIFHWIKPKVNQEECFLGPIKYIALYEQLRCWSGLWRNLGKKSGQKKLEFIYLWSQNHRFIKAQIFFFFFSSGFPRDYCGKIWLFLFVWILIWNLDISYLKIKHPGSISFHLDCPCTCQDLWHDRLQSPYSSAGQQRTISYRIKPKYFQDCLSIGRWDTINSMNWS